MAVYPTLATTLQCKLGLDSGVCCLGVEGQSEESQGSSLRSVVFFSRELVGDGSCFGVCISVVVSVILSASVFGVFLCS